MRATRSKTANRRSHHALVATRTSQCSCGALKQPHRACRECGKYGDKVAVDVVARAEREARRAKKRQAEMRASGQTSPDTKESKEEKK